MKKSIYSALALMSIFCSMAVQGMARKQELQRAIIKQFITDLKLAQQEFDEKKAQEIKTLAEAVIPKLESLDEEEKVIALSEVDELMRFFKPVAKPSKQEERKKEVAAMPAAPGGPRMVKPSETEVKKEAEPKKVIKQKPMSKARQQARFNAKQMQETSCLSGYPHLKQLAEERKNRHPFEREYSDQGLFIALSEGEPLGPVGDHGPSVRGYLGFLWADPNALIATKLRDKQGKKIKIPAFWGLIDALMQQKAEPAYFHNALLELHRYGADLDMRADDGTPILNYLITYWPNWETADHLPFMISQLMHFGVDLNAIDAKGDTFLDALLKRFDDPLLTGKGIKTLNWIIESIDKEDQKQELRDMVEEYKREHIQPARQAIKRPKAGEAIPQPGIRNIMAEYLFGEEPAAKK